ncbi:protein of unknown function [Pseudorhizobium banfieldiae]|uniref:Secreted protein n=1 Tax=Pseudorhizobium banfieldiae TaxID=1125847 RepID=L0NIW9_9HYPH|nr:protein of unknown function [Pseudorhizobium banfieldiae]
MLVIKAIAGRSFLSSALVAANCSCRICSSSRDSCVSSSPFLDVRPTIHQAMTAKRQPTRTKAKTLLPLLPKQLLIAKLIAEDALQEEMSISRYYLCGGPDWPSRRTWHSLEHCNVRYRRSAQLSASPRYPLLENKYDRSYSSPV